jgi:acyl carrier protein
MDIVAEKVKEYLVSEHGLDEDFGFKDKIFSSGILDSLDVIRLLEYLEKEFKVTFNPFSVGIEDFDTIELISKSVSKSS